MPTSAPTKILIVDDEAAQMKALCDTLRDEGYVAVGVLSATDALAAMRSQTFDLLLTDLSMPEMDGITLLRAAMEIDSDLVAIMMTGHGTIDTAVEAIKVGALDYIIKPFKLSVIVPVLSRAVVVRRLRFENARLTQCVQERTTDLEAANHDLEAFSYSVAHDLRAPLRAVDGFANILLENFAPQLPPGAQHLLSRVTAGAQHMGSLIEALLRLSRLGRQPLAREPVNIRGLVERVLERLRSEQPDRQIALHLADLPDTVGDRSLLEHVFANLLSNAFKFTRQRQGATLEIGCAEQQGENVYFVRDNGAGFDMKFADKLRSVSAPAHGGRV